MASRTYVQTIPHLLSHYLGVLRQKIRRALLTMLVAILVFVLICALLRLVVQLLKQKDIQLVDIADWLLRVRADREAAKLYEQMSPFGQLAWRTLGITFEAVATGFVLEAILAPTNLVKFARYAVIDTVEKCLKFRFWIALPEKQYLSDATIDVIFEIERSQNDGSSERAFCFRFIAPADSSGGIDQYFGIRGVRTLDIPFDSGKPHGSTCTLAKALSELADYCEKSFIRVRIKGTSPSGASVLYEHRYKAEDVLYGYKFVSIRKDEIERFYNALQREEGYTMGDVAKGHSIRQTKAVQFTEHLDAVTEIIYTGNMQCVFPRPNKFFEFYICNIPHELFVLNPGEHVTCTFRLRVWWYDTSNALLKLCTKLKVVTRNALLKLCARLKVSTGNSQAVS